MSVYKPKTDKLAVPPNKVIRKVIESMNNFIVNNLNSTLHTSCIAVLDNDPNPDTNSEYYKAAQNLKLIAKNALITPVETYDSTGNPIINYVNINMNPYKYRIIVVDPDGVVVFDSEPSLEKNVNAQPPENPVNKSNHNNYKCVMATIINSVFNLSNVSSINTSIGSSSIGTTSNIGSGSLTGEVNNNNNAGNGTLRSQLANNSTNITTFSEFKYSRTRAGMLLYVAVALSEDIQTIGTLIVSTQVTNK